MRAGTPHRHRLLIIDRGVIFATTTTAARAPIMCVKQSVYVAATAFAKEIGIICGRADANRCGRTTVKIAQVMSLGRSRSEMYRAIPRGVKILEFVANSHGTRFHHG